jgi:NitT/TauT family transport system permease protein
MTSMTASAAEIRTTPGVAPPRDEMARLVASSLRRYLAAILLPLVLVALWQLAGKDGAIAGGALPTPDRVWASWKIWAFGTPSGMSLSPYVGTWVESVLFSAQRVAKGFALAIAVGVPLGILIGWSKLAQAMVDPTIQWLRPVPITAWLPISIAIFGIADFGAIFLITIGAFYPIVINTTQGARDVETNWIRAAQMMGANRFDILRRIVLPAALPSIFTGLRIGLGIGWTAVIVSEMVAVKSGLGYVLWDAYYVGRMDIVIADMVSIGLVGFLSDWLIVRLEMWVLRWRRLQSFNK